MITLPFSIAKAPAEPYIGRVSIMVFDTENSDFSVQSPSDIQFTLRIMKTGRDMLTGSVYRCHSCPPAIPIVAVFPSKSRRLIASTKPPASIGKG